MCLNGKISVKSSSQKKKKINENSAFKKASLKGNIVNSTLTFFCQMPASTASLCRSASVPASFRPCWYVWPPAPSRILPAHFIISCWLPTPCSEIRPVPHTAAGTLQAPGSQTSAPGPLRPSQRSFLFRKWPNRNLSIREKVRERRSENKSHINPPPRKINLYIN